MQLPADPILSDRWRLLSPIGEGAMGEVWHGRHEQLGHDVAVKIMKSEAAQDDNLVARFRREARIAAQMRSKHIVRVEDFGVTRDGRPFLVMEFLRGQTLASVLEKQHRPDRLFVLKAVQHIATACDIAHPAGIVHRDLKPENCFVVADDDGEPLVKVLDFGIAKVTDNVFVTMNGVVTGSHALLGTPVYMSPEQARGEPEIDGRSDLWSLGVITYEMLMGKIPFEVGSLAQVLFAVLTGPIPPPSKVDPTFTPAMDAWVSRALSRDKSQRFSTGKELASALAAALGYARVTPSGGGWASVPPAVAPSGYPLSDTPSSPSGGYVAGNTALAPASQSAKYPAQSATPSISQVRTAEMPAHSHLPSAASNIDPSALTWSGNGGGGVLYPPLSQPPMSYTPPPAQIPQSPQMGASAGQVSMVPQIPIGTMGPHQTYAPYLGAHAQTMPGTSAANGATTSKKRRIHPMGVIFLVVGVGGAVALATVVAKHRREAELQENPQLVMPTSTQLQTPINNAQFIQPQRNVVVPLQQPAMGTTADAAVASPRTAPINAPTLTRPTLRPTGAGTPAQRDPINSNAANPTQNTAPNQNPHQTTTHPVGEQSFENP